MVTRLLLYLIDWLWYDGSMWYWYYKLWQRPGRWRRTIRSKTIHKTEFRGRLYSLNITKVHKLSVHASWIAFAGSDWTFCSFKIDTQSARTYWYYYHWFNSNSFFSNWKVRLVDDNENIVDIGVLGEVQVKTYSLLREYKNDEEKTKKLFTADGFMRTGWILLQTLLLR